MNLLVYSTNSGYDNDCEKVRSNIANVRKRREIIITVLHFGIYMEQFVFTWVRTNVILRCLVSDTSQMYNPFRTETMVMNIPELRFLVTPILVPKIS